MATRLISLTPLFLILFCSILLKPVSAVKKSYVVYFGAHSHNSKSSLLDLSHVTDSHYQFLESYLESRDDAEDAIFYSYTKHINGFAAVLEEGVAADIAKHPNVMSVFENKGSKLHTTRSWHFMGLEHNGNVPLNSIWKKARYGEDVIIGNLDTGVWPESKSFSEEGYGPIPSKWKGTCQNGTDSTFLCNRKLIGARYFNEGYSSAVGPLNQSFNSPRDLEGHGSHTLSTSAGNFVGNASIFGYGTGTAKGGSPKARVATYKVCWPSVKEINCFSADILAAFDEAINDGVDVLSVSLGGEPKPFFNDAIAIGSFHAVRHGIVVVCSAGNSGPEDGTVSNLAPWQITVGASTMDREFPSFVALGNGKKFKGQSLSVEVLSPRKFYPLITGADARNANSSTKDALLCEAGTLDRKKVEGKILICLRGVNARVEKGEVASLAGAIGMILVNNEATGNEIIADAHVLPASHISYYDGLSIFTYIQKTRSPTASITSPTTKLGIKPAPYMAAFSSRGPNIITPEILKPDITAPGVSVIAAYTEAEGPTNQILDKRRVQFNAVSGTSMSCPHISGIVGLLKTIYPTWSPTAIRSAIMTSARTRDNNKEQILNASSIQATPFSYGAGHVEPNKAMDPGLVYDLTVSDYLNFLCFLGYNQSQISRFSQAPYHCPAEHKNTILNLNYPSITVPYLFGSITVTRTVKNVGSPGIYKALVRQPSTISILVVPSNLKFKKIGEEKSFNVTLKAKGRKARGEYVFGELTWSDGKHYVSSPIVVKTL